MAVLKDVIAKGGSYTTSNGEEKVRFVRCGVMMETKNGPALKLDAMPVNFDGWLYLRDPKPKKGGTAKSSAESDDAPF
jgi:hypothetical protein